MLQSMGSQRVRQDRGSDLTDVLIKSLPFETLTDPELPGAPKNKEGCLVLSQGLKDN